MGGGQSGERLGLLIHVASFLSEILEPNRFKKKKFPKSHPVSSSEDPSQQELALQSITLAPPGLFTPTLEDG